MLRITKLTDYAVVLLTRMAARPDGASHTARELSAFARIPQPTVSKILKDLAHGGVLASQRGVSGGFRLARPARDISVADVIDAVEGPIAITECTNDDAPACEHVGSCPTESSWLRINDVVRRALAAISLASMVPTAPVVPLSRLVSGQGRALRSNAEEPE